MGAMVRAAGGSGKRVGPGTLAPMMELELRLAAPAAALPKLLRRLQALPGAVRLPLRAIYFDTAERQLAKAGWGLRLRHEQGRWVQTLKGPLAADGLSRPEHNAERGDSESPPVLDLGAHAALPAAAALFTGLDAAQMRPQFETRIERWQAAWRQGESALLWALDQGELLAGGLRAEVAELELEWQAGPLAPLFELAESLVQELGLAPEPRSKAARGGRLAAGQLPPPADFDLARSRAALQALRAQSMPA
jgi:triphosphatase